MALVKHKNPSDALKKLAAELSTDAVEKLALEKYKDPSLAFYIANFGVPEEVKYFGSGRASHGDMKEVIYAFDGFNSGRLLSQIEIANTSRFSWVNLILPRKHADGATITIRKTVYHQGLLDREPELTASKVMEKTSNALTFNTSRFGKSLETPLDIMQHPEGRTNLKNQIAQLNSAIMFTQQYITLNAISERAVICNTAYLRKRAASNVITERHEADCFTFGMLNRHPQAIYYLIKRAREAFKVNSTIEPNVIICGDTDYTFVSMHSPFETKRADPRSKEIMKHPESVKYSNCEVFEMEPMSYEGNSFEFFSRVVTHGRSHSIFCEDFVNYSAVPNFDSRRQMSFSCYNVIPNAFQEVNIRTILDSDPRWDDSGNFHPLLHEICNEPAKYFKEQNRHYTFGEPIDPYCFSTSRDGPDHVISLNDRFRPCDTYADMEPTVLSETYLRFMSSRNYQYAEDSLGSKVLQGVEQLIDISRELNKPPNDKVDEKISNLFAAIGLMEINQPSAEERPYLSHTGGSPQLPHRNPSTGYLYMLDPITNFKSSSNFHGSLETNVEIDSYAQPLIVIKKNPGKIIPPHNNYTAGSDVIQYAVFKPPKEIGGFMPAGNSDDQVVTHVLVRVSSDDKVPLELQEIDYTNTAIWPFKLERCRSYDKPYGFANLKALEYVASLANEDGGRGWDRNMIKKVQEGAVATKTFLTALKKMYPESAFFYPGNVSADLYTGDVHHDMASAWFEHTFLPFTHNGVLIRTPSMGTRLRLGVGSGSDTQKVDRKRSTRSRNNNHNKRRKGEESDGRIDHDDESGDDDQNDDDNIMRGEKKGYEGLLFVEGDVMTVDPIHYVAVNIHLTGHGNLERDNESGTEEESAFNNVLRVLTAFNMGFNDKSSGRWAGPYNALAIRNGELYYKKEKITENSDPNRFPYIVSVAKDVFAFLNDEIVNFISLVIQALPTYSKDFLSDFNPSSPTEDYIYEFTKHCYEVYYTSTAAAAPSEARQLLNRNGILFLYLKQVILRMGETGAEITEVSDGQKMKILVDACAAGLGRLLGFIETGSVVNNDFFIKNNIAHRQNAEEIGEELFKLFLDGAMRLAEDANVVLEGSAKFYEEDDNNNNNKNSKNRTKAGLNNKKKDNVSFGDRIDYDNSKGAYRLVKGIYFENSPVKYHVSRLSLDVTCFFHLTETGKGIQKLHTLPMWPNQVYDPFFPPVPWFSIERILSGTDNKENLIRGFKDRFTSAYTSVPKRKIDHDGVFIGSMSYMGAAYNGHKEHIRVNANGKPRNSSQHGTSSSSSSSSSKNKTNARPMSYASSKVHSISGPTHKTEETSINKSVTVITRGDAKVSDVLMFAKNKMESFYASPNKCITDDITWASRFIGPNTDHLTRKASNVQRYNMVDRYLFCHEKPHKRLENGISLMILSSPTTRTQMTDYWLEAGLPIPYSYTAVEPFNQTKMGSMFIADRNGLGNFYFNDQYCGMQLDNTHLKYNIHYKVGFAAVLEEPDKAMIIADSSYKGIVKGFDMTFNVNRDDCDFSRSRVDASSTKIDGVKHSAFVFGHGPGMKSNPRPFITLTGMLNPAKYGASQLKQGESVDYQGSLFYTQYWSFHVLNQHPDMSQAEMNSFDDLKGSTWINDNANQWIQYNWDPLSMKYSNRIKGEGMLGDWESDNMKAVLNGEMMVGGNFDSTTKNKVY